MINTLEKFKEALSNIIVFKNIDIVNYNEGIYPIDDRINDTYNTNIQCYFDNKLTNKYLYDNVYSKIDEIVNRDNFKLNILEEVLVLSGKDLDTIYEFHIKF